MNTACPIIGTRHKNNEYSSFGYFTFVSDRDKGIIAAVKENHHVHCIVHIACNVTQKGLGNIAAKSVSIVAGSYNIPKEQYQFDLLKKQ